MILSTTIPAFAQLVAYNPDKKINHPSKPTKHKLMSCKLIKALPSQLHQQAQEELEQNPSLDRHLKKVKMTLTRG